MIKVVRRLHGTRQARNEKAPQTPLTRNFSLVAQIPASVRERREVKGAVMCDWSRRCGGTREPAATSSIRPWTRRKFGDEIDVLAITPDAQGQPRSGRLPGDHFDQFVGLSDGEAGGAYDLIPDFQAGNFGYALVHHPVDAGRTIAFHQRDAEPWTLSVRRFVRGRRRQRKYGVRK
jgi:hypothetical protein